MAKALSKRELRVLYITVAIIAFAVIFNFIIGPLLDKNEMLNKNIQMATIKIRKYQGLLKQADALKQRHEKLSAAAKGSIEDGATYIGILSNLEDLARASGIRILDIRPQIPAAKDLYREIVINLRAEGRIEDYLKFMYNIESSLSLFKITRFQLNAQSGSALLEGRFSISRISLE